MSQTKMLKPVRIIKIDEVLDRVALSKSTIERGMNNGTFPKSIKLSVRSIGWLEPEIDQWIEDRVKGIERKYD